MEPRTAGAWLVHLYTTSGLVLAALAAVAALPGDPPGLRLALLLLWGAAVVDATDGWLARRLRVAAVLPSFDGRRLDDLVDFQSYTVVPLFLVWRSGVLAPEHAPWLLVPLVASVYGFSQTEAKTDDGSFLGFPSYWNVVALYAVGLRPPSGWLLAGVLVLALLTFVPVRYPYPSRPGRLNRWTARAGAVWGAVVLVALLDPSPRAEGWILASLVFPVFYISVPWLPFLRAQRT